MAPESRVASGTTLILVPVQHPFRYSSPHLLGIFNFRYIYYWYLTPSFNDISSTPHLSEIPYHHFILTSSTLCIPPLHSPLAIFLHTLLICCKALLVFHTVNFHNDIAAFSTPILRGLSGRTKTMPTRSRALRIEPKGLPFETRRNHSHYNSRIVVASRTCVIRKSRPYLKRVWIVH